MKKTKVFLTGGDEFGWAVDEDLKLTREAIYSMVDLVDLEEAEVVHALWWFGLLKYSFEQLGGKRIICHIPGEPSRYFAEPSHRHIIPLVGRWITRTRSAREQLRSFGIYSDLVPYLIDTNTFRPMAKNDLSVTEFAAKWNIPRDKYLIGNFQRDTEGADMVSPKLVKGPDILLEILLDLKRRGIDIHLVVAGPRRQWIMNQCRKSNIDFTYCGQVTDTDDFLTNSLQRSELNLLYNLIDMYIVASRSEGGPHAILEAAASKTKIVSTRTGMGPEVLDQQCLFRLPFEAASIIAEDKASDNLFDTILAHYETVQEFHRPETVKTHFEKIYADKDKYFVFPGKPCTPLTHQSKKSKDAQSIKVSLWHSFYKPPYGGGNQFMMALRKALLSLGVEVVENELDETIDAYVLNSIHFDVDRFLEFSRKHRINVIHRIDGPISLIRGYDREKDELCYSLNEQFASATVLQSAWVYQKIIELGYNPVSPTIIHNAVDSEIFNSDGRIVFSKARKIKLISSSWSNNPRKGGPLYKWIEDHLDWDRFDYTFVGNASETFSKISYVSAVPSEELAALLKQHDIYITASQNDPCSNALIEALACGLPALYLNEGGHPELASYGGLPFHNENDVLTQLDKLVDNYEPVQNLITVSNMNAVASKYLSIIRDIIQ